MTDVPTISIIVTTCGERSSLPRTLSSLLQATTRPPEQLSLHLVLVQDGPPFAEGPVSWPGPVDVVRLPRRLGIAGSRNAGLAVARGALCGFVDDDGICGPGWLDAVLEAFADPTVMVIGGVVVPADAGRNLYSALRDRIFYPEMFGPAYRSQEPHGVKGPLVPSPYASGGNAVYRTAVLRAHGGFDASLPASVDTELGARLRQSGVQPYLERRMVLIHEHPSTWCAYLRRGYAAGVTRGRLARRKRDADHTINALRGVRRGVAHLVAQNVTRSRRVRPHPALRAWAALQANDLALILGTVRGLLDAPTTTP